jgi:hypothetical protein
MVSLVRSLEHYALEKYKECPKFVTIVAHADLEDDSEFHCVLSKPFVGPPSPKGCNHYQKNFIVPGQKVINFDDDELGKFVIVKVIAEDSNEYWLIVSVRSRIGFILSIEKLPDFLRREELCM